ncbi:MAG: DUF1566 domain-containing protein [Proteobacteria bacterium]|nr:DUF1566 domain-containing protein [Pseudomonadota bacterium]
MKYTYRKNAKVGLFITVLLAVIFGTNPAASYADFQRTKIAVLDFELIGDKQETSGMGSIVSEWFTTGIVKYGRFDVVERAMLQKIISEQKLSATGMIDETSAATLGKILGVKVIISGSVVKLRDLIEINSRVINVENGSIIAAESSRGNVKTEFHSLVDELLAKIISNFPLTGYVVKKNPKTVIIDLGLSSGLKTGTEFYIYKEGEVIKHPKTGEILDVEQVITGRMIVTEVSQSIAEGEIQSEEGGGIQYGQLVKSVQKEASKFASKKQEKTVEKPIVENTPEVQEQAPVEHTAKQQEKTIFIKPDLAKDALSEKASLKEDRILLRKDNIGIIGDESLKSIIRSKNFYEKDLNPSGSFENSFERLNDEVLIDKKTNLVWQIKGSQKKLTMYAAKQYIKKLNSSKYAGNSDWRLPSIEELASLMKKNVDNGYYLDPSFSKRQSKCWSNDEAPSMNSAPGDTGRWLADYENGLIAKASWFETFSIASSSNWTALYVLNPENYVRAVCTMKETP